MIHKLDLAGVHMTIGEDLKRHVMKKIGRLDRYLPKHAQKSVHAEVKLKEGKAKGAAKFTCEVIMHLPGEVITLKEVADNMFAAINVAEEKVKIKLHKYKELHGGPQFRSRLLTRLKNRPLFS